MTGGKICLIQPLLLVMAQKSPYDIEVLVMLRLKYQKGKMIL